MLLLNQSARLLEMWQTRPGMSFPFRKNNKRSEAAVKVKGEVIKLSQSLAITFTA